MNLILAVTGATGAYAARLMVEKSPWPVALVVSDWGREVCRLESTDLEIIEKSSAIIYQDDDLSAPISSGSVPTAGMVILPCSADMLARVSAGMCDTLIARAAHCHLKEQRKLVMCIRETPWTAIDCENAKKVAQAGGTIMPLSPPFYMTSGRTADEVSMHELMEMYIDRVLGILGVPPEQNWETIS